MRGNRFGRLLDREMQRQGMSNGQLSAAIGLFGNGRYVDRKTIERLRAGQVRHPTPEVLEACIRVLELDPRRVWAAAYPDVAEGLLGAEQAAGLLDDEDQALADQVMGTCNDESPLAAQQPEAA